MDSKNIIVTIIYLSMFLDNILLTVVVPIIPDYLLSFQRINTTSISSTSGNNLGVQNQHSQSFKTPIQLEAELMENENGAIGMLLSSKAIIQLVVNPCVGYITGIWGYHLPLFIGTVHLLAAALLYTLGESYASLLLARSLQGVASSLISVSGLCMAARIDTDERNRARTLGFVLGSVALGVLSGYPLGGFLYDFIGKSAPFIVIALLILFNLSLQIYNLDLKPKSEMSDTLLPTRWSDLLTDPLILLSAGSIWISTSALAVLEPCLPIWLMENLHPEKWQLGTVFIPDSLGYLIGTNCFGVFAYRFGRWRVAMASMITVGICTFIVPTATHVTQLLLPHFGLGLGIGVIDSALVPLLAHLVDTRHQTHYGAVYALQQVAVSLAYSVGPILGGELVKVVGFPWVIRTVGIINILYCPWLIKLKQQSACDQQEAQAMTMMGNKHSTNSYQSTISGLNKIFQEEVQAPVYHQFQNTSIDE